MTYYWLFPPSPTFLFWNSPPSDMNMLFFCSLIHRHLSDDCVSPSHWSQNLSKFEGFSITSMLSLRMNESLVQWKCLEVRCCIRRDGLLFSIMFFCIVTVSTSRSDHRITDGGDHHRECPNYNSRIVTQKLIQQEMPPRQATSDGHIRSQHSRLFHQKGELIV